jgi:hypothetical protein
MGYESLFHTLNQASTLRNLYAATSCYQLLPVATSCYQLLDWPSCILRLALHAH